MDENCASRSDADPDPAGSPTGQELVDDLEKILAKEEAEKYPPPGSREDAWMMKVLEQATRVHCFAEEICNETARKDWQLCAYQLYRWQMDQEVGHLYALFGGPEEDEVRVKGQRQAKAWMDKAVDSVERARRCVGRPNSTGRGNAIMMGRPWKAGPVKYRRGPPLGGLIVPGGRDPGASKSYAAGYPAEQANQAGIQPRQRLRMAALSFHQALQTARATRTALSPVTPAPRTPRRTPSLQKPRQRGPDH